MKLFAVADVHACEQRLQSIVRTVGNDSPDAVIIAGDLISFFKPEKTLDVLRQIPVPVLFIKGNTDTGRMIRTAGLMQQFTHLHLHPVNFGDHTIVGIDGTLPLPFSNRVGFHEKRSLKKLEMLTDRNTILVSHTPPRYMLDKVMGRFHSGSKGLHRLVTEKQPMLVICGHIHENHGVAEAGPTRIVNCSMGRHGNGYLIILNKNGIVSIKEAE